MIEIARNPTREQVTNHTPEGWSVFSVGITGDFRVLRRQCCVRPHPTHCDGACTKWNEKLEGLLRIEQLLVQEGSASWHPIASATTADEALDEMHTAQATYVKRVMARRRSV